MLVDTCDSTLSFATNQDLMVSKLTFTNILGKKKQKTSLPLIFQDTPNSKRHLSPQFHGVGPTLAESVGTHTPGLASRLQEIDSEMALFGVCPLPTFTSASAVTQSLMSITERASFQTDMLALINNTQHVS